MPLNRFSNLEEVITKKEFLIEFRKMNISSSDDLFIYKKLYNTSMKEFKFSILMMYIFGFFGFFVFLIPGIILFYFAIKFKKRASLTTRALDEAIKEYSVGL